MKKKAQLYFGPPEIWSFTKGVIYDGWADFDRDHLLKCPSDEEMKDWTPEQHRELSKKIDEHNTKYYPKSHRVTQEWLQDHP